MEADLDNLALKSDHSLQEQEKLLFNYTPEEAIEKIKPKWNQYDVEKKKNLLKLLKCCYGDNITNTLTDFHDSQVEKKDIVNPIEDKMQEKSDVSGDPTNSEIEENKNDEEKEEEQTIEKIETEEKIKEFIRDYVIFWHDPSVNSSINQKYLDQLKKFCDVKTFTEYGKAVAEIQGATTSCHVITSGTDGELLVKEIYMNENVKEIYLFCKNKDYHSTWAKKYLKVSCVETQIQNIIDQIKNYFCS